ncbi:unnamed protein product [Paramecium sonneborni]|uniref:Uncharacterized protein n=1 Tax=Paramecium sonneborni TaxID=65129 RepID=A0A8S1QHJ6_9CILI|nr:unnamed protein product [Paramecium sonneborni]
MQNNRIEEGMIKIRSKEYKFFVYDFSQKQQQIVKPQLYQKETITITIKDNCQRNKNQLCQRTLFLIFRHNLNKLNEYKFQRLMNFEYIDIK